MAGAEDVRLARIRFEDWPAVYSWARLPEASRFQPWGPDTEDDTKAFVQAAADAWAARPQVRYAYKLRP